MSFIKDIIKLWNKGFERGLSLFQWVLISFMIIGVILSNNFLVLFCMFNVLFFYFEPKTNRRLPR